MMNNALLLKIGVFVLALLNVLLCKDLPFFWDHIALSSKFANHFFENGIFPPIVPEIIDHGHPPFFAIYLNFFWLLFGKNLLVSHIAMFPFLVLVGFQWIKLCQKFIPAQYLPIALLGLLAEPSFLTQSTMIGGEIPLLAGVLLVLNGIIYNKHLLKFFGLLLCGWLSIRGSMWCIVLFSTDFMCYFYGLKKQKNSLSFKSFVEQISPYLLAGSLVLAWYIYHYIATGYLLVGENSAWASNHTWNFTLSSFLYNTKMLLWCIGDFGRIGIYLSFIIIFFVLLYQKNKPHEILSSINKENILLFFLINTCFIYFPVMIFRSGNTLRRYLIPLYLISILIFIILCIKIQFKAIRWGIIGFVFLLLASGHFWIYPIKYAQDWDASLAHLPYFNIEQKMRNHIESNAISPQTIATGFPTYNSLFNTYLLDDKNQMKPIRKKMVQSSNGKIEAYLDYPYILYSNVHNQLLVSDIEKFSKSSEWESLQKFESNGVYMELFKRKKK